MSSSAASMDISETFRPEDLSKTDFFDFVTAPDMGINVVDIDRPPSRDVMKTTNGNNDNQPLQGFDQFWGADKESNRIDTAMFEDLNRYCWNQPGGNQLSSNPSSSSISDPQLLNADGQIYTITVLNSSTTDQWLRKDIATTVDHSTGLDLDTILSNYPYVKTECFSYDDSGFGTDHTKDDIVAYPPLSVPPRPIHQSSGVTTTTNIILERNMSIPSFDQNGNNSNEWHLIDEHNSPESLLRSALQGKGYVKTLQTQNGITVIPVQNPTKDDQLRSVLFSNDQDTITFADSTLTNPIFEDDSNHQSANVGVDDMFLTLDSAFTDDFEKIKRIASEVQQFCSASSAEGNHSYPDILIETAINQNSSILTTNDITNNNSITINNNSSNMKINKTKINAIKTTKKYKKSLNNNTSNSLNNNNTSTINNNLSTISASKNVIISSSPVSSNPSNASPTHGNGQRKERSLHYCTICGKGFKDKYSVNVHIRTHTGEKPFACGICGKSFRQKAHLAKHYQTHLAQKNASGSSTKSSKQPQQQLTTSTPPQQSIQSTSSSSVLPANTMNAL